MAKIFINRLLLEIEPAMKGNAIKGLAYNKAKEIFDDNKEDLLDKFENHIVSLEIDYGPNGDNISNTLSRGELFSFIGFRKGTDPLQPIREILQNDIQPDKNVTFDRSIFGYILKVNIPPIKKIYEATPYPDNWNPGSWVRGIETYISGLGFYLYKQGKRFKSSRSGPAVQIQYPLRSNQFKRTDYLGKMLQQFRAKFRGPKGRFF